MSDTAARLAAYKAAELSILEGQTVSAFGRQLSMPDLVEVRKAIAELELQKAREDAAASGRRSFGSALSNFNCRDR